jgi:hypothetical protein
MPWMKPSERNGSKNERLGHTRTISEITILAANGNSQ